LLKKAIVTGLGTGYLPVAQGTWGSAAVAGIFLLTAILTGCDLLITTAVMAVLAAAASVGCVALGRFAEQTFGKKDPEKCTADEWAGQAVALLLAPISPGESHGKTLLVVSIAFLAFRVFDVVKPPPARLLERLPHGWGVLADDLTAGAYALISVQLLRLLL